MGNSSLEGPKKTSRLRKYVTEKIVSSFFSSFLHMGLRPISTLAIASWIVQIIKPFLSWSTNTLPRKISHHLVICLVQLVVSYFLPLCLFRSFSFFVTQLFISFTLHIFTSFPVCKVFSKYSSKCFHFCFSQNSLHFACVRSRLHRVHHYRSNCSFINLCYCVLCPVWYVCSRSYR